MPDVLDWRGTPDPRPLVHRAAQALAEGGVVAFPTDTVYALAASALIPDAVERLVRAARPDSGLALAVRGAADALDWVPDMSTLGRRLAKRCWPGPVTLVFGQGADTGLATRLPEAVRDRLLAGGAVSLRSPAHRAPLSVMPLLPGPLVLADAGERMEEIALVVDDGPPPSALPPTWVRVAGGAWEVVREGAMPADALARQTTCLIVFVCTGNTCRSPLAEALFKKKLADRLGIGVDDLAARGFLVTSAGVAAMMGGPAAEEAVETARAYGADLTGHASQPLAPELAAQADFLVAMTHGHAAALRQGFPRLGTAPRLLATDGTEIADPIGCDREVYRACAAQIWQHLDGLTAEVVAG